MRVDSTFPDFPGYVIVPDQFTWPQLLAFGKAVAANQTNFIKPSISHLEMCENSIFAINAIVDWHIEGLPQNPEKPAQADIFIGKPTKQASAFFMLVYNSVLHVWNQEKEVPKASSSELTNTLPTQKPKTKTAKKRIPAPTN